MLGAYDCCHTFHPRRVLVERGIKEGLREEPVHVAGETRGIGGARGPVGAEIEERHVARLGSAMSGTEALEDGRVDVRGAQQLGGLLRVRAESPLVKHHRQGTEVGCHLGDRGVVEQARVALATFDLERAVGGATDRVLDDPRFARGVRLANHLDAGIDDGVGAHHGLWEVAIFVRDAHQAIQVPYDVARRCVFLWHVPHGGPRAARGSEQDAEAIVEGRIAHYVGAHAVDGEVMRVAPDVGVDEHH